MSLTDCAYGVIVACLLVGFGWVTRGWHEAQQPKPIEVRRVLVPIARESLLGCPRTLEMMIQWDIACRARERTTAVKSKGRL